jgi:hypothetical protein
VRQARRQRVHVWRQRYKAREALKPPVLGAGAVLGAASFFLYIARFTRAARCLKARLWAAKLLCASWGLDRQVRAQGSQVRTWQVPGRTAAKQSKARSHR